MFPVYASLQYCKLLWSEFLLYPTYLRVCFFQFFADFILCTRHCSYTGINDFYLSTDFISCVHCGSTKKSAVSSWFDGHVKSMRRDKKSRQKPNKRRRLNTMRENEVCVSITVVTDTRIRENVDTRHPVVRNIDAGDARRE